MERYLFRNAHLVVDGEMEYPDGALLVNGETIEEVFETGNVSIKDCREINLNGALIMPGAFDSHTHGGFGITFDEADESDVDKISLAFAKEGTTSFLASLSYDLTPDEFIRQLERLENAKGRYARFEGIHLEGPFLSRKHIGVGAGERFLSPDVQLVRRFLSVSSRIRQMTIAPEEKGAGEVDRLLHENGIRVMCGHTDALLEDLDEYVDGFTHLFNAMRGLHHRDITPVNCAFMNRWNVELIADGNHILRSVLKLAVNNIARDKLMIVSDSSLARGLPDGEYRFMSMKCIKKGTTFITDDGHFAGSVVSINDEMKVLRQLGVSYTDLLRYSSLNAFVFYGLDRQYGTIEKGKHADIVIMDEDLNIREVYVRGQFVHGSLF